MNLLIGLMSLLMSTIPSADTKTKYDIKLHYFQVFQKPNILIITKDHMGFILCYETTMLKFYILTLPWSVRPKCKGGGGEEILIK